MPDRIEQVALQSFRIPEKGKGVGSFPSVEAVFERLHHDRVFKEVATQRVGCDLAGIFYADQVGGQANIMEIELGCLDQALADVGKVRSQSETDEAPLQ